MTEAVSDREYDAATAVTLTGEAARPAAGAEGPPVNVAWAGRLFALLCAGVGVYVAVVSLSEIRRGHAAPWLLPLVTGGMAAVLCGCVVPACSAAYLSWRSIGRRTLAIVLLSLYAFVLLPTLGFLLASLIFVTVVAMVYAPNRFVVGLGGAVVTIVLWALFAYVVSEPLPVGWLWR
ncbi:MAG TPA: tripartite tricarboxylate transporter TctB family protein [Stellaceae bacterium]|nr:tripartite tricarboxylate transporter TctB family protein [Stellaceae bacterium]